MKLTDIQAWLISPKDRSNRTCEFRGFHNERVVVALLTITWPTNASMFSSSGEGANCEIAFNAALLNLQKTLTAIKSGTANVKPAAQEPAPEVTEK